MSDNRYDKLNKQDKERGAMPFTNRSLQGAESRFDHTAGHPLGKTHPIHGDDEALDDPKTALAMRHANDETKGHSTDVVVDDDYRRLNARDHAIDTQILPGHTIQGGEASGLSITGHSVPHPRDDA